MAPDRTATDGHAFQSQVLPHLDALYRFALHLSGVPMEAEDLVQETMLKAFRAWDRFQPGNVRAWLMTILRNHFIKEWRKRRRQAALALDFDDPNTPDIYQAVEETDPEGDFLSRITDQRVVGVIDALPRQYRVALVLSDVDGMSYAEIAQVLGIPLGTVRSRIFRARRKAQAELHEYAVAMGYVRPGAAVEAKSSACRAAKPVLLDYLKKELTPEVAMRIRDHLGACCECQACARFQKRYLSLVASILEHQRCPEEVRAKILSLLSLAAP